MFQKSTFAAFAVVGIAIFSGAARAQFGPAIGPPPGPVPTTPSPFPPITVPAPPPGWMGSGSPATPPATPAPAHNSYKIYYRVSANSPWRLYATFNSQSDTIFAVNCLKGCGYDAFYR